MLQCARELAVVVRASLAAVPPGGAIGAAGAVAATGKGKKGKGSKGEAQAQGQGQGLGGAAAAHTALKRLLEETRDYAPATAPAAAVTGVNAVASAGLGPSPAITRLVEQALVALEGKKESATKASDEGKEAVGKQPPQPKPQQQKQRPAQQQKRKRADDGGEGEGDDDGNGDGDGLPTGEFLPPPGAPLTQTQKQALKKAKKALKSAQAKDFGGARRGLVDLAEERVLTGVRKGREEEEKEKEKGAVMDTVKGAKQRKWHE